MAKYKKCPKCFGRGTEAGGLLSCSRCKGEGHVEIYEPPPPKKKGFFERVFSSSDKCSRCGGSGVVFDRGRARCGCQDDYDD